MTDPHSLATQEGRLMTRLARLFRAERNGALARRPAALAEALLRRRDGCIAILHRLEAERRRHALSASQDLNAAASTLAAEVKASQAHAEAMRARLRAELRALRGEGEWSGVTGLSRGEILGRG